MPDSLPALEAHRSQILRQIGDLGDLRPGSICAVARRCGKPTCHCAKPNDPGHDPQLRLTRTVNGKTVAESFATPAAFHKAQTEVREYQRLQKLYAELVAGAIVFAKLTVQGVSTLPLQRATSRRKELAFRLAGAPMRIALWPLEGSICSTHAHSPCS